MFWSGGFHQNHPTMVGWFFGKNRWSGGFLVPIALFPFVVLDRSAAGGKFWDFRSPKWLKHHWKCTEKALLNHQKHRFWLHSKERDRKKNLACGGLFINNNQSNWWVSGPQTKKPPDQKIVLKTTRPQKTNQNRNPIIFQLIPMKYG